MPVRRPTRRAQLGSSSLPKYCLRKSSRVHAMRFGETQQAAFERHETAVDAVHLIDQRLDAVVVELEALDEIHRLVAQLLEAAFLAGGKFVRGQARLRPTRPAACRASCRARRSGRASPAPAASASLPSRESDRLPSSSKSSASGGVRRCGRLRRHRVLRRRRAEPARASAAAAAEPDAAASAGRLRRH